MLVKLAGPFRLRKLDETPVSPYSQTFKWVPEIGLCILCYPDGNFGYVTVDGYYAPMWGAQIPYLGWSVELRRLVFLSGPAEYSLDPLYPIPTKIEDLSENLTVLTYLKLKDRRIKVSSGKVYAQTLGAGDVWTLEADLGGNYGRIQLGRNEEEALLVASGNPGYCQFYDVVKKQSSSPRMYVGEGVSINDMVYSPEYGILVALDSNAQISLWSLEVVPASLSAPALVSSSVSQGHVATFRVQVLGDHSEVCSGELVDWSITGAGVLATTQSVSDAQGYAQTSVIISQNSVGSSLGIEASLRC